MSAALPHQPFAVIDFPDAASNEAALPQLTELLTRLLNLPLSLRVAAGADSGKLAQEIAVLQRRFPAQLALAEQDSAPADLAILPGQLAPAKVSSSVEALWRQGTPIMLYAALEARQQVETLRAASPESAPPVQWFHRTDVEALWDAAWAKIKDLELLGKASE